MSVENWPANVNKRILRNPTSWSMLNKVVEDKTLSGKTKRRLANSLSKQSFSVKMRFSYDEFVRFKNWYENNIKYGLNKFYFPQIDDVDGEKNDVAYQFAAGSEPKISNPSGKNIDVTMTWERV